MTGQENEHEFDPLDEEALPVRDNRGRFRKGSSGNPRGRKMQFPRDPNLPAAKRRIISAVADEVVEVKVAGKLVKMTIFEANVRALALDGTKNRISAQRFIDLACGNSERDLARRLVTHQTMEHYDQLERENERMRAQIQPRSGVLTVPCDGPLDEWSPHDFLDDDKLVGRAMGKEPQEKKPNWDSYPGD